MKTSKLCIDKKKLFRKLVNVFEIFLENLYFYRGKKFSHHDIRTQAKKKTKNLISTEKGKLLSSPY